MLLLRRVFFPLIGVMVLGVVGSFYFMKKPLSSLQKVTILLDWAANTNHTGLYVAQAKGYFKEQGYDVEIIQPSGTDPIHVVATDKVDFGVSSQEGIIQARVQGVPVVSIAAMIQHNTSGFASPLEKKIKRPHDFENKTYGGFGFPVEKEMVCSIMQEDGANPDKVNVVFTGNVDFFTVIKKKVDFMWIYYGWTGIEAELRGIPVNMIYLTDYSKDLDYYTPVLITSENKIKKNPQCVSKMMTAIAKGYQDAINYPDQSAALLLKEQPGLNPQLVRKSQQWLSPRYQADASQWGIQKIAVWENYAHWLKKNHLLEGEFHSKDAFTNQFLPKKVG